MKGLFFTSLLLALVGGSIVYEYLSLPDVSGLRKKNPRATALMELREEEYRKRGVIVRRDQIWVPYDSVSEHLKRAILVSEDASFFTHNGVDFFELKEAFKKDWEKGAFRRGASTITMQLARNLYLSPSKDPLRKLREIIIAFQLERTLSKRRIFEIYLNVVEWGRSIYGAEAASRAYFKKSASDLSRDEAAFLSAMIPSPLNIFNPLKNRKRVVRRQKVILRGMNSIRLDYSDK